ncbi:MAG: hypothetical protein R2699_09640 [Acidimicrobiales bacterium]
MANAPKVPVPSTTAIVGRTRWGVSIVFSVVKVRSPVPQPTPRA